MSVSTTFSELFEDKCKSLCSGTHIEMRSMRHPIDLVWTKDDFHEGFCDIHDDDNDDDDMDNKEEEIDDEDEKKDKITNKDENEFNADEEEGCE